jgi:hypothetical protein
MFIGQGYRKWLGQREREALATACTNLIGAFFEEWPLADSWEGQPLLTTQLGKHLPPPCNHIYTPSLYKPLGICMVTEAWKLAQQKPMPLASPAEALAAWILIEEAKDVLMHAGNADNEDEAAQAFQPFLDGYIKPGNVFMLFELLRLRESTEAERHVPRQVIDRWFLPFSPKFQVHLYTVEWGTTPRVGQAYKDYLHPAERQALDAGVVVLIDEMFDDSASRLVGLPTGENEQGVLSALVEYLPPRYLPKYTPEFLKKFAVCILTVAWKLGQARLWPLSSIAEELAAHAILM